MCMRKMFLAQGASEVGSKSRELEGEQTSFRHVSVMGLHSNAQGRDVLVLGWYSNPTKSLCVMGVPTSFPSALTVRVFSMQLLVMLNSWRLAEHSNERAHLRVLLSQVTKCDRDWITGLSGWSIRCSSTTESPTLTSAPADAELSLWRVKTL